MARGSKDRERRECTREHGIVIALAVLHPLSLHIDQTNSMTQTHTHTLASTKLELEGREF